MNRFKIRYLIIFLMMLSVCAFSQTAKPTNDKETGKSASKTGKSTTVAVNTKGKLIQFSGVVVESDSLKPLPYTSVLVKGTNHGTVSDFYGFFTIVAQPGDEIEFGSVAYKNASYLIPDTLAASSYSIIQVMRLDTFTLSPVTIYPWPTREEFKKAFLKLEVPHGDYDRAQKNLAESEMRELARGISMDAQGNYRYSMQQRYTKLYYAGQYPPNNLLNPVAWAKFIKAWKEGKLKIQ